MIKLYSGNKYPPRRAVLTLNDEQWDLNGLLIIFSFKSFSCMLSAGHCKTHDLKCQLTKCKYTVNTNNMSPSSGDSTGGLEAAEVLRYHRGHGDSSSHHASGDWTIGSVHSVQYSEEVYDC